MFCGNCGKELKEEAKFCPHCGMMIGSDNQNPTMGQAETESFKDNEFTVKKSHKGLIIGIISVVVIALLLVLILMFTMKPRTSQTTVKPEKGSTVVTEEATDNSKQQPTEDNQKAEDSHYVSGTTSYNEVEFRAEQTGDTGFVLTVTNNTGTDYTFGWVSGAKATLTTTEGTYYTQLNAGAMDGKIGAGSVYTKEAYFNDVSGEWLSISVDNLQALSTTGLPTPGSAGETITIELAGE